MRKFIHKTSTITATECADGNYSTIRGNIPKWAVEDSNDWVETTDFKEKVIFVSTDGIDIKFNDTFYWVDNSFRLSKHYADYDTKKKDTDFNWFGKKENAEQFVLNNKPSVSLNDVKTILGITEETKPRPEVIVIYEKFKKLTQERIMQNL